MTEELGGSPERDEVEHGREHQKERDSHHDLRGHQREQHQEVRRGGSPAAPSRQTDGQRHTERGGHQHGQDGQSETLAQGEAEGLVVEHRLGCGRITHVPSGREALPGAPRASGVEREEHGDPDRDDRPEDVHGGDDRKPTGSAPWIAQGGGDRSGGLALGSGAQCRPSLVARLIVIR